MSAKYCIYCIFVVLYHVSVSGFKLNDSSSKISVKFYSREDWGAQPATDTSPLALPVPYVVIHHTYIPGACYTVETCSTSMRGMQNYHKNDMNWGDIGYNFCVGSEGGVYEGRGWSVRGIHAGAANRYSIGICLIGDWRTELPPAIQLKSTKLLILKGLEDGVISRDYKVIGHRQAMPNHTECPGDALADDLESWDHYSTEEFSV